MADRETNNRKIKSQLSTNDTKMDKKDSRQAPCAPVQQKVPRANDKKTPSHIYFQSKKKHFHQSSFSSRPAVHCVSWPILSFRRLQIALQQKQAADISHLAQSPSLNNPPDMMNGTITLISTINLCFKDTSISRNADGGSQWNRTGWW